MTHDQRFAPAQAILLLCTLVLAAAGPLPAAAQTARESAKRDKEPLDPKVQAIIDRFEAAQKTTKTMTAEFRQVKEMGLLAEPSVQTGRFAFSYPNNFRWDYEAPDAVTVLVTKDEILRYIASEDSLVRRDISKNRRRVFNYFGIGSDVSKLKARFHMKVEADDSIPNADRLELTGRQRRIQKRLRSAELWIDRTTSLPAKVRLVEADGDTTTWTFTNMAVNTELPAETYELKLTEHTVVKESDGSDDEVSTAVSVLETALKPEGPGESGAGSK